MKLGYSDLISPNGYILEGVGTIISPTLRQISETTKHVYDVYLSFLNITPETYCNKVNKVYTNWYSKLNENQILELSMFDLAISITDLQILYTKIFNFFFKEVVTYSDKDKKFITCIESENQSPFIVGEICKDNFHIVCDIILQLNHIKNDDIMDLSKVKNKKGLERFIKIQKLKQQNQKDMPLNPDMELGNIISSVCSKHPSLNYVNIWDITIYQLWDTFNRMCVDSVYDLNKTSVSIWGDKTNKFDLNGWFENILKH